VTYIIVLFKFSALLVPPEIVARGPEAEKAYWQALEDGEVQVYRGRIMLIGQDRAGKTSLKKSLLGLLFDPEEPSTVGIDVDPSSFCVDVDNVTDWRLLKDNPKSDFDENIASIMAEKLNESREAPEPDSALGQPTAMPQKVWNMNGLYGRYCQ
jgi:predicted ATP-dependent endonuclease of OLD family